MRFACWPFDGCMLLCLRIVADMTFGVTVNAMQQVLRFLRDAIHRAMQVRMVWPPPDCVMRTCRCPGCVARTQRWCALCARCTRSAAWCMQTSASTTSCTTRRVRQQATCNASFQCMQCALSHLSVHATVCVPGTWWHSSRCLTAAFSWLALATSATLFPANL